MGAQRCFCSRRRRRRRQHCLTRNAPPSAPQLATHHGRQLGVVEGANTASALRARAPRACCVVQTDPARPPAPRCVSGQRDVLLLRPCADATALPRRPRAGVSTSVPCNPAILAGPAGNNTNICNLITSLNLATMVAGTTGAAGQASGNIDPLYGQYFTGFITTTNGGYTTPNLLLSGTTTSTVSLNGTAVAPQAGWGGGPNVTLGPQTLATAGANVVWGVHTTPYTAGMTLAQQATSAAVRISWFMGDNTLNLPIAGGSPPAGQSSPAAFVPRATTFAATISYGTSANALTQTASFTVGSTMTCLQYFRPYTAAIAVGQALTYTSPYICHATLTGLTPTTSYFFTISAVVNQTSTATATTYATPAATTAAGTSTYSFNTMIPPSGFGAPSGYPFNWALMVRRAGMRVSLLFCCARA